MAISSSFNLPETAFVLRIMKTCNALAATIQDTLVTPAMQKQDRSPVTVADFAVQAVVAHALTKSFPADSLVAEESADSLRLSSNHATLQQVVRFVATLIPGATGESVLEWIDRGTGKPEGRFWVLDPIDGTKGFLRNAQYAVALALLEDGQVQLAALGCPRLSLDEPRGAAGVPVAANGSILVARRGEGCWRINGNDEDPVPLRVSEVVDPKQAIVVRSVESGHTDVARMEAALRELSVEAPALPVDSQAKYALLAAAKGDLLARLLSPQDAGYREKIWDQAPGALIAEEAGGVVTDSLGCRLDFTTGRRLENNQGVVASNGRLHEAFLRVLNREN